MKNVYKRKKIIGRLKSKDPLQDPGVDGIIIVKCT